MRAVTKYPGSKWNLANWIISHFPPHHSYVEPFFGSGAVLFNKPRSRIETVNDLDGEVANLFTCIREDPERLARLIYLTPYARTVFERNYQARSDDLYQRAYFFMIRLNMGYGMRVQGRVGWNNDVQGRQGAYAAKHWADLPEILIEAAERLRGVQIENRPALQVISRFNHPNVLIYADPPYMLGTRNGKQYHHEMDDGAHSDLLDILLEHRGPVILSGYQSDLYQERLINWHRLDNVSYSQAASKRIDVLWMNFMPVRQNCLFEVGGYA